jgi:hypothetical protein
MVFSAQSVPMASNTTMKYLMTSLSNNCTATEDLFSAQSVPRCYKHDKSGFAVSYDMTYYCRQ